MAIDPQQLTKAVACWLEFEAAIGREGLFDESYLAYPFGAFLHARGDGKVLLEEKHPVLAVAGKGRPAAIDFVVADTDAHDWEWAIETKFITDARDYADEIFADILRLECLVEKYPAARRIMVIAGTGSLLKALLVDRAGQTGGTMQPLFPPVLSVDLGSPSKLVPIENSVEPQRGYWKGNKPTNLSGWPGEIESRLIGKTGDIAVGEHFVCLVWEILSPQRPLIQLP